MYYRREFQFDSQALAVAFELFLCEVCPIVCDDAVRYSESKYYRLDNVDCCYGFLGCYWGCLYPFSKFVYCHQHVDMPS
jgi:hypothetical protein